MTSLCNQVGGLNTSPPPPFLALLKALGGPVVVVFSRVWQFCLGLVFQHFTCSREALPELSSHLACHWAFSKRRRSILLESSTHSHWMCVLLYVLFLSIKDICSLCFRNYPTERFGFLKRGLSCGFSLNTSRMISDPRQVRSTLLVLRKRTDRKPLS